jgi:CBS-domain-containing membrane protein
MQSGYAAISIFIITFILYNNPVVIASIGSMAFIVFSMPNSITAQPRRIIGGHLVGFFVGSCFAVFPFLYVTFYTALWYALFIGITLFIMVVMDFEHPPAAGTALGMTLVGYTSSSAVAIIISVFILTFMSYVAKPFLRDLI